MFHGRCELVQIVKDRFGSPTTAFYDRTWSPQGFTVYLPRGDLVPAPGKLAEMIEFAELLAGDLDFARIDLYLVDDDHIIFGEITVTSWAGWEPFEPQAFDFELGALWKTPSKRCNGWQGDLSVVRDSR